MTLLLPAVSRSGAPLVDVIHCCDIFDLCAAMPDQCVDLIISDLPYGSTDNHWDRIIPFVPMWKVFRRIIKPHGAMIFTATMPFAAKLVMSASDIFRHDWIWNKNNAGGAVVTSKYKPVTIHEQVLVFALETPRYYPIMTRQEPRKVGGGSKSSNYRITPIKDLSIRTELYPKSIMFFSSANQGDKDHPTQKPVALFEYLIRTYTRPGDLVFDPCVGSGTTALAARNTGRHYICGDSSPEYVAVAKQRLAQPYTMSFLDTVAAGESQEKHIQNELFQEVKS